jgi:Ser/Thr protein kinase RdoA (MazF antagonist)
LDAPVTAWTTPRPFPVQDSTLSAGALAESVLSEYGLADRPVCRFYRKGICDTYRVTAGDREYYLKVYRHGRRTELDVSEEVRLLNHLAANGISVARPVARRDGTYVDRFEAPEGPRYAVLYEAAQGVAGDGGDLGRIAAFGEMVGRMHQVADRMEEPYRRDALDLRHLVDDNLPAIGRLMAHREADFELVVGIAEVCKRQVAELLPTSKPAYGICHGDLHGGDVCYDEHGIPVLFDFDSSGCGWRALDVGVFLASDDWMDTASEAEARRQRRLEAFLDGYSSIRELTEPELAAVQLGPPIRHIFLMGFVLRYTATWQGQQWANDDFIDWHLTWFRYWAERNL